MLLSKMLNLIVLGSIFYILISLVTDVLGINDACVNVNRESGTCMSLQDCGLTYDVLLASSEAYNYAKNSKCGSGVSMVCCNPLGYKVNLRMMISTTPSLEEESRISPFSDSSVCGIHRPSNKIKGGILTEFDEFPWLAGLEYVSNYDHENKGIRCGGSLLNQKYVLTAAHCIRHLELVLVKVWLGATNISSDGKNCLNVTGDNHCVDSIQKFEVKKTFIHSRYDRWNNTNDIALVQLDKSVKFSGFVRPICVPSMDSFPLRIQSYFTVAGWGATENSTSSDIKLKVEVPLQTNSACSQLWKWGESKITSEQLCVGGEPGKDSCQGDSGGPLMKSYRNAIGDIQWVQVGIVSYGDGCGVSGRPAVYVKVASYVDWIVQTISGRGSSCTTPNFESGMCVPARSCKVIVDGIKSGNSDAIAFAKQSQCGYDSVPLVCCGSTGYQIEHSNVDETKEESEAKILSSFITKALPNRTICGWDTKQYRISRGGVTDIGEYPWMAALEYKSKLSNKSAGIRCGGTLINNRYVMTAAHCIIDEEFQLTKVWLGDWNLIEDPDCEDFTEHTECAAPVEKIDIKTEIPHPFYSKKSGNNNIGLIRLGHDVNYTEFIRPICLPPANSPLPELGTAFTVVGWGATKNGRASDTILQLRVPILENSDCKNELGALEASDNQLCIGGERAKKSCRGDSGGPLMGAYDVEDNFQEQWYQEGVLSYYGVGCRHSGNPAIYTRVSRYIEWILKNIEI